MSPRRPWIFDVSKAFHGFHPQQNQFGHCRTSACDWNPSIDNSYPQVPEVHRQGSLHASWNPPHRRKGTFLSWFHTHHLCALITNHHHPFLWCLNKFICQIVAWIKASAIPHVIGKCMFLELLVDDIAFCETRCHQLTAANHVLSLRSLRVRNTSVWVMVTVTRIDSLRIMVMVTQMQMS